MAASTQTNQWAGILRIAIPTALAYFVSKGYMTTDQAGEIGAYLGEALVAIVSLLCAIWSWRSNRPGAIASQLGQLAQSKPQNK